MDGFTAEGALKTGVDLIRRRPLLILLWAGLFLAWAVVNEGARQAFQAWRSSVIATGRTPSSVLGMSMVYSTGVLAVTTVVQAVIWTSAFRAFLRPNDRAPMALGREELVVTVSWVIVQLILALASAALTIFVTEQAIHAGRSVIGPMLLAPAAVLAAIGLYWAAVAGTWAFARGEIGPLRCWTMLQGRFWTVTGLVAGLAVIAYVLQRAMTALIGVVNHHASLPGLTLQTMVGSPLIFITLAGVVVSVLQMIFVAGIVTSACRTSRTPSQAASVSTGSAASAS